MKVPKKHRKNDSKNRFWDLFWPPKPFQNRRKIEEKSMLKKDAKKLPKKCQHEPTWETCLSNEREERRHIGVVEACNHRAPTAPKLPPDHSKSFQKCMKNTENVQKDTQNPAQSSNSAQAAPRPFKILPESPKPLPNPSQNPPQTLSKSMKNRNFIEKINFALLGPVVDGKMIAKSSPRPSKMTPKSTKNR